MALARSPYWPLARLNISQMSERPDVRARLAESAAAVSRGTFLAALRALAASCHPEPSYAIRQPLLLLRGERDRFGGPGRMAAWAARDRHAALTTIPGAVQRQPGLPGGLQRRAAAVPRAGARRLTSIGSTIHAEQTSRRPGGLRPARPGPHRRHARVRRRRPAGDLRHRRGAPQRHWRSLRHRAPLHGHGRADRRRAPGAGGHRHAAHNPHRDRRARDAAGAPALLDREADRAHAQRGAPAGGAGARPTDRREHPVPVDAALAALLGAAGRGRPGGDPRSAPARASICSNRGRTSSTWRSLPPQPPACPRPSGSSPAATASSASAARPSRPTPARQSASARRGCTSTPGRRRPRCRARP